MAKTPNIRGLSHLMAITQPHLSKCHHQALQYFCKMSSKEKRHRRYSRSSSSIRKKAKAEVVSNQNSNRIKTKKKKLDKRILSLLLLIRFPDNNPINILLKLNLAQLSHLKKIKGWHVLKPLHYRQSKLMSLFKKFKMNIRKMESSKGKGILLIDLSKSLMIEWK